MGEGSCLSLVWLFSAYLRRTFAAAGLSSQTLTLDSGATTLHFYGPQPRSSSKPSLLLLHGFGPSALYQWRRQAAALAPIFDLYVPDLLFFGGSAAAEADRSEIFQARCLGRLMVEALGIQRFSVVGTSYGGFVAYRMAEIWGEAVVERVVVASSAVNMVRGDGEELVRRGKVGKVEQLMLPERAPELRRLLGLAMFRPPPVLPDFFLNDVIDKLYSKNRKEKLGLLKELTIGQDETPKISPLKQEVLIVWGDHDQIFPVEKAHQLKELLGEKAKLEIIKNTSHAPQVENPEKFNQIVKDFLYGS